MASHDQRYRAGETMGRTEEKTNRVMGNLGEKAQAVKEKTQPKQRRTRPSKQPGLQRRRPKRMLALPKRRPHRWGSPPRNQPNQGRTTQAGSYSRRGEKVKGLAQSATDAVTQTLGLGQNDQGPTHHR